MRVDTAFEPIETERLVLRRSTVDDAQAIAAYRADPEVARYQCWDRVDLESVRTSMSEMAGRDPGEPGWVQFSVEERDGGAFVGDVGLSPDDEEPGVIKVGYTMAPAVQGRGYATEAIAALFDYAFDTLEADTVIAYASAENRPSHRVAEKVGLRLVRRFEGRSEDGTTWRGVRFQLDRPDRSRPRDGPTGNSIRREG